MLGQQLLAQTLDRLSTIMGLKRCPKITASDKLAKVLPLRPNYSYVN